MILLKRPVGSRVEMRLVHIFEMRGGKISREGVRHGTAAELMVPI
jgi:hypothetical protein